MKKYKDIDRVVDMRVVSNSFNPIIFIICLLMANAAVAEESGIKLTWDNELRYSDNVFLTERDKKDSWVLQTLPKLTATAINNGNVYQISYGLDHAEYFDFSDDNYTDHNINLNVKHSFNDRNTITLKAEYANLTEGRGTGFSEGINAIRLDDPDDYERMGYGVTYKLGSQKATGRLTLSAGQKELDYDSTIVGDSRDYQATNYGIAFNYKIGARTEAVVEYRFVDTEYDNTPMVVSTSGLLVPIDLDSDEQTYLVGIDWRATAKTTGKLRLGRSERDFQDNSLKSSNNFHWELSVSWQPKTYTEVTFQTGRSSSETNGAGSYINTENYDLGWQYAWNGRLSSQADFGLRRSDYDGDNREDDELSFGFKFNYDMRRWLDLGFGYRYDERDSTFFGTDYEQNVFFIDAKIEL